MPYVALVFCTLVWGATFPATKVALAQVPPFTFLFLRFVLGTLLAVGWLLAMRGRLRCERDIMRMGAIATVFLFLGFATQTIGLRYTSASNSAFITALYVVLVPLFLRRFDRRTWVSAGLALWGLWYLVNPAVAINQGDLWSLACAVGFAGHIACLEAYTQRGQSPSLLIWQVLFLTAAMAPGMAIESPDADLLLQPTWGLLMALVICGVFATGALAAQIWAQRFVPAQRVALIFILEPVCAALMSWYFLGEELGPSGLLGGALILLAVFLGSVPGPVPRIPGTSQARPLDSGRA